MTSEQQTNEYRAPGPGTRSLALWEVASVVTSAMIAEWVVQSLGGRARWIGAIPVLLALGLMIFSHRERGESPRDLGFRWDNFWRALRLVAFPTIVAVLVIILVNGQISSGGFSLRPTRGRLLLVPLWALFQQYALHGFINRRSQLALGKGFSSTTVVALVFGLMHLPSPLLSLLALVGGFTWAWVYQRQPNLFALALSHTIVSLTLSLTIPASYTNQLRVGFKYFGMDI